ncbi:hypothetical protein [Sphingobacterium sp. LRF_L2]|uniref:hypothetical protein n=1 Tax=Sphingobacterium sp. LRF_L2 TaxID=3369421 RepID=UPI003F5DA1EE
MKNQNIFTLFFVAVALWIVGCDKDDNDNIQNEETAKVSALMRDGNWTITRYKKDGIDLTTRFDGFSFQFNTENSLLAIVGETTYTGSWSVTADDDRTVDLDLNIFFSTAANLQSLNDDWDIISYTATRIEVADDYGEADEDLLIFEKQ